MRDDKSLVGLLLLFADLAFTGFMLQHGHYFVTLLGVVRFIAIIGKYV